MAGPRAVLPAAGSIAIAGLIGCGADPMVLIPPVPEGAVSMVLAIERPEALTPGTTELFGIDLAEATEPLELSLGLEVPLVVTSLGYELPLEQLGLSPGRMAPPDPGRAGAALPPSTLLVEGRVNAGRRFTGWRSIFAMPASLRAVRIASPDGASCLNAGGCFSSLPSDRDPLCKVPCAEPAEPDPPAAPRPPALTPPPEGWVTTEVAGVELGLPWPREPAACLDGQMRTPLAPGCADLGPCVDGEFAEDLPAGARFVRIDAAPGGDGTRARPFRSLAAALARPEVQVVALGPGRHLAAALPARDLTLIGPCASRSTVVIDRLQVVSSARLAVLDLAVESVVPLEVSGTLVLERARAQGGLRVAGQGRVIGRRFDLDGVVQASRGGTLELEDGRVAGGPVAIDVAGATTGVRLRGVTVEGGSGALNVGAEATAELDLGWLESTSGQLVRASGAATVENSVLWGGGVAAGVQVFAGGSARLSRTAVLDTSAYALNALGGRVEADDCVLAPAADAETLAGRGLEASLEGVAELTRVRIVGAAAQGIVVVGPRTELALEDVSIEQTGPLRMPGFLGGSGLRVETGATATGLRVRVEGAYLSGITLLGQDSTLRAEDLAIEDIRGRFETGKDGRGLRLLDGAVAEVTRLAIRRATAVGILVEDARTRLDARHVRVEGTRDTPECSGSNCNFGRAGGVRVELVGEARLSRFLLVDNGAYGLALGSRATVDLQDGRIRGHQRGLIVAVEGYSVQRLAERVRIDDAVEPVVVLDL